MYYRYLTAEDPALLENIISQMIVRGWCLPTIVPKIVNGEQVGLLYYQQLVKPHDSIVPDDRANAAFIERTLGIKPNDDIDAYTSKLLQAAAAFQTRHLGEVSVSLNASDNTLDSFTLIIHKPINAIEA